MSTDIEHNLTSSKNKIYKTSFALKRACLNPSLFYRRLKSFFESFYLEIELEKSPLKKVQLSEIISQKLELQLSNFGGRDGNVTEIELLVISSLIRNQKPSVLLELGTFDGNTTLQMALNAPSDATVHTLDLPPDPVRTKEPLSRADLKYALDKEKLNRKYLGTSVESKIVQYLGDSTNFDFAQFTKKGTVDFAFIDAGHTYDCVKSDTRNVFQVISNTGIILWHDYHPFWNGVYTYLNELGQKLPLLRIAGTNLAYHQVTLETKSAFLN